ncbi:MAG: sigma-70 family RNA polymerase sigma factor [Pirellulales bacterium]
MADDSRAIDARVIDAVLAGDRAAYGRLVQKYQDRLFAALVRVTGCAEEAEDVAQEAFVQALLKLDTFQQSAAFYTWLYRIAFNLSATRARRKRPRTSLDELRGGGGPEPASRDGAPEEPLMVKESAKQVHVALGELPEDYRQVIVLRELEGCDYDQIAEILQIPLGTVRSRLFRAREQLRELLAPVLDGERNKPLAKVK